MAKLFICIALVLVAVVAARPGGNKGPGGNGGFGGPGGPGGHSGEGGYGGSGSDHGNKNNWATKLCANGTNGTAAQSFLTQTQQLITTLQANGTYTSVLQKRAQEITYIQDASNADLLTSNCTAFFSGLSSARDADKLVEQQQRQSEQTAAQLFFQIISSLVGGQYGY